MNQSQGSKLERNEIRRFEVDGVELTSGSCLEVLLGGVWVPGRVEYMHPMGDYAFITTSGEDFETYVALWAGMIARLPARRQAGRLLP
ncbi:MAG: DUF5348 domain-containing protein [Deltaproteobacteria bacterium]|nr:DUF5348 domain-containing protein [Deltaproteobacteria bacterium]